MRQRKILLRCNALSHRWMVAIDGANPTNRAQADASERVWIGAHIEHSQAVHAQAEIGVAILQVRQRSMGNELDVDADTRRVGRDTFRNGRQ